MPVNLEKVRCGVKAPSPPAPDFNFLDSLPTNNYVNIDWSKTVPSWPMLGNDKYSCCTIASIFHFLENVGSYAGYGKGHSGTEDECLDNYSKFTGFNRNDPATDLGGVPVDILRSWHIDGIGIDGIVDRPDAIFQVSPNNVGQVSSALALFGPLLIVGSLPETIEGQNHWTCISSKSLSAEPASFGNHQFLLTGFDGETFKYASWDEEPTSDIDWWNKYIIETWPVIHSLWLYSEAAIPGFDYNFLISKAKDLHINPLQ